MLFPIYIIPDPKSKSTRIMYPNKIGLVEQLVRDNIPGVKIIRTPYVRLRYRTDRNGIPVSGQDMNAVLPNVFCSATVDMSPSAPLKKPP